MYASAHGRRILNAVGDHQQRWRPERHRGQTGPSEIEWRHEVDVITIEIEQIERQILGAERRRDIALRELNNHQREIEHSIEVQNFLRDKFTNEELYLFLAQETSALYRQAYEIALTTARQAERAFNYERGHTSRSFVPDDPWDDLHEGLLAGEGLQLAIRQMEKAYLDESCREYELTKHISLRLSCPVAFLALRSTGYCEIELPEWLFDLDYPGHYMRRIKNVTLSIPCVLGTYTGLHCRLTLLSSTTRVDPRLGASAMLRRSLRLRDRRTVLLLRSAAKRLRAAARRPTDRPRLRRDRGDRHLQRRQRLRPVRAELPRRALPALRVRGRGQPLEDQTAARDELLRLRLARDVVMHLNHTAREGGEVLRAAAAGMPAAGCPVTGAGSSTCARCRTHGMSCGDQAATTAARTGCRSALATTRCSRSSPPGACGGSKGCRSSSRLRALSPARTTCCGFTLEPTTATTIATATATATGSTFTASPATSTPACTGRGGSRRPTAGPARHGRLV